MAGTTLFHDARLALSGGLRPRGWLLTEGGRIADLGWGQAPALPHDGKVVDAAGLVLAPGLIDIHAHGALGHDTMDASAEGLRAMARFYAAHGVTAFLATTMTACHADIMEALANMRAVMAAQGTGPGSGGAQLLGAHVEGPYLDVERRGAQKAAQVRRAVAEEYDELLATGVVRLLTVAPEYRENKALIRRAVERGVVVSLGHTRATYEQMARAVALGASQVTHLFNGLEPLHHRKPGAVGAALTIDGLRCQLIADNIHVHPVVLKLAHRAKGSDGIILISDAMAGTGMPDGRYHLGDSDVIVDHGVARIPSGNLAGSTLTLERAVGNMMAVAGISLFEALQMATATPARALGLAHKGRLRVGADADLILLSPQVDVRLTMVGGEIVYRAT